MTLAGVNYSGGIGASQTRGRLQIIKSEDEWTTPPPLDEVTGSAFGYFDRIFSGYRDGMVFDYGDWEARDIETMLNKGSGYKAKQIEMALTMPIMAAEWSIKDRKDSGASTEFLQNFWSADPMQSGSETTLDEIIDLNTSAISYKRAYWEFLWTAGTGDFEGKTILGDVQWRPQTTCRLAREVQSGKVRGFEQEAYYVGPEITQGQFPLFIPKKRAYVYLHGKRRNPLHGTSDLEVPFWCYKTTTKLLFLWYQFLEGVSLPRTVVMTGDQGTSNAIAAQVARLKSSGVLPVAVPGNPAQTKIESLDLSGKGAEQFQQAISWLDQASVNSVMAGFLNLTNSDKSGGGFALSKDGSDFFLQTREADAREMERSIREDLFGPLVRYNFKPDVVVPDFKFEPLNSEDKSDAIAMLTALMQSQDPSIVPGEFISQLAAQVSDYLGMDGSKIQAAFEKAGDEFKAQQEKNAQMAQQISQGGSVADPNAPGAGVPTAGAPNVANAAKVAGAVNVAAHAVKGAQTANAGGSLSPAQSAALKAIQGG